MATRTKQDIMVEMAEARRDQSIAHSTMEEEVQAIRHKQTIAREENNVLIAKLQKEQQAAKG